MGLKKSNYRFDYRPIMEGGGMGFEVSVSGEFIEFARDQNVNGDRYEKLGFRHINNCGWSLDVDHFEGGKIFNWEGNTGLLHHVVVPGNAAGMCLEEGSRGGIYLPANIDTANQAVALLAMMTHYLNDIESRIPEDLVF